MIAHTRLALASSVLVAFAAPASAQASLLTPEAELVPAGAQALDRAGSSVALSGDRAFVAAPGVDPNGVVHVFVRGANGWAEEATLVPTGPATLALAAVDADGDTVALGMVAGQVNVFVRSGPAWTEQAVLTDAGDDFGYAVALCGDTLAVGSPNGSQNGIEPEGPGTAHVFVRVGSQWLPQGTLPDQSPNQWGDHGARVALSGDTALVSEVLQSGFTGGLEGRVQVFTRTGGTWAHEAELAGPFQFDEGFGRSLALDGDVAVVGSGANSFGIYDEGAAHVFERAAGAWTPTATLRPALLPGEDDFPYALALSGNALVATTAYVPGRPARAHWFSRDAQGWVESATLMRELPSLTDGFGRALALEGDAVLVGAPSDSGSSGSAHVFRLCSEIVSYCTAGTSAGGCQALLAASGAPSATAPSGFTLQASGVEGQRDGLFFYGSWGRQANPWGNGSSYQCVVPPVTRGGVLAGSGTPGVCDGAFAQDLNGLWTAKPAKNPGAGAVVQAQLWYRDPASTSNQTTSLSDAVEFCVQP